MDPYQEWNEPFDPIDYYAAEDMYNMLEAGDDCEED